ncbi:MAG: hypothetical protein WCL07_04045 [bacterium]
MQKNLLLLISSVIFALLLLVVLSPSFIFHTLAVVTTSPSPIVTPTDNQITETLKERLKVTLNNVEQTASPSAVPISSYRAIVGVIKDVIQKTLIVETKDGKKQVVISDNTTLLRSPGNIPIKLENVRIDDYLIAMGTFKEDNVLEGRRLIASVSPLSTSSKVSGYGQIIEIKNKTITLNSSGEDILLTLNEDVIIKSKDKSSLTIKDLTLNSRVIYTAEKNSQSTTATVLMIIQ